MKHLSRTKLQPELGSFEHQIQNMTLKLMPKKLEKKNIVPKLPNLVEDFLIDNQRSFLTEQGQKKILFC